MSDLVLAQVSGVIVIVGDSAQTCFWPKFQGLLLLQATLPRPVFLPTSHRVSL